MSKYIIKRVLMLIPVIIGVSFLVFVLLDLAPGNVLDMIAGDYTPEQLAALEHELGYDRSVFYRYGMYMWDLLHGDLGTSYIYKAEVWDLYMQRLPSTLKLAAASVLVSLVIGVPLGAIAGYYGKTVETIIMRFTDIFSAVPAILMAVVVVSVLGSSTLNLMIAVGISSVPGFVRTTRAAVLTVRNQEYIEAAKALGKSDLYIIFFHVLPNCLSPIIVQTTLRVASAIVSASSLSFLGLGIQPPAPEWGALLTAGKSFIRGYSYLTLFPGLAIMITVLAFNLVGDGLRDAMDPKLKR